MRVAPQRRPDLGAQGEGRHRGRRTQIPEDERDYYLERKYPSFGNLAPRDIASRAAKEVCDEGRGVGPGGLGVYLDFADAISRLGEDAIRERYGNLFEMYERITDENPYQVPMRIYPAVHYTMGGLWVDYNLMSTIPGLFVIGEANFSDHGANRLGASALMQGLADGYFIIPYTIGDYLGDAKPATVDADHAGVQAARRRDVRERGQQLLAIKGKRTVDSFHRELGKIMWDYCGMARNAAGLERPWSEIPALREEFWRNVSVPGSDAELNQSLEKAGRVADFLELARADVPRRAGARGVVRRPLPRGVPDRRTARRCATTSISPRRAPGSTPDADADPSLHKEPLAFEYVHLAAAELQVKPALLHVWRQAVRERPGALRHATRRTTSAPTCRSSRCSTWSTSGSIERARSRSPSTTTAARGSAARAA